MMLDQVTSQDERAMLAAEQRAELAQCAAEAALRQAEDAAVVEDLDEVVTDHEQALAQLRAEPDDDRPAWRAS